MNKIIYNEIMRTLNNPINESFSEWKEINVPKFDDVKFRTNMNVLFGILNKLMSDGEVEYVSYLWSPTESDSVIKLYDTQRDGAELNDESLDIILSTAMDNMKDNFAVEMKRTCIYIKINKDKYLNRYISDNTDINGKLIDVDGIVVKHSRMTNANILAIYSKDILENLTSIVDFLN